MSGRIEEYKRADGFWSHSRHDAILVSAMDVVTWLRSIGTVIPEIYYLGTAQHESGWARNERDSEPADALGNVFQSWGLYQISDEERRLVGRPSANLLDVGEATWVMIKLAELRRMMIRAELQLRDVDPDPEGLCAYLAIGHNLGMRSCLTSIRQYTLDWPAYKSRNPSLRVVSGGYGDAVLPEVA